MPFSSISGKSFTKKVIDRLPHAAILDIGCGCGNYADMFPDSNKHGVEIWEPYVEQYKLKEKYQKLTICDARAWTPDATYDVAIAGDVLEHMTKEDAQALLAKLLACADTVVVSIPIVHYPQGEMDGNPYEAHITDNWSDASVREAFGEPKWSTVDGEIGVYIWSKHKWPLKICVYAISKNEELFVDRFCASAKDADLIVISDTGSTDKTRELIQKNGAVLHDICITPWRFDVARNAALALVPRDVDICISLDLDEFLCDGWRAEIERVWTPNTTRLSYYFDWGATIKFKYQKIHARHGYSWKHPCHEVPVPDSRIKEVWADTDMLLAIHNPDPTKSRGQYLELLEMSVDEDPSDPHNAFYLAREYMFYDRWRDALTALTRYLAMPEATWQNERCYATRLVGVAYKALNQYDEAERWFHKACAEAPTTREPWCDLAMLLYQKQRWAECYGACVRALEITNRELVYTCDPAVWGHWPHDLASISAWHLELYDVAIEQAQLAVAKSPNDSRLINNLEYVKTTRKLVPETREFQLAAE